MSHRQVFIQVFTFRAVSIIPFHSNNSPHSSSSTYCSYQKNGWTKPENLQKAVLFWISESCW